ncbi:UNVERIFIED_CONTAM: YvrJ family protein [Halobacillus marinus]|uniref:YvrJ family protein n=1 Tax=Halobacillus sp. BAB-2008 TaxID=1246484 RepID=UPI0002DD4789|nr:YvrJ family protein [Halobacillus sp. BAB-2008]
MTLVDLPQWIVIIGNFGFPVAITFYLFVRFEKKLDKLENVIMKLSSEIEALNRK